MNVLALCAGVGSLDEGIRRAVPGAKPVCYVEREAFSAAVLVARMEAGRIPYAPIWSDVATFDARPWRGAVDCISAGYPCQPFSSAGSRKGTDDDRWIWPDILRIIGYVEPAVVFFENVPGHINKGLDQVWADLRRLGFDVAAGTFTAQEIGACHIRKRLFILATHPERDSLRDLAERGQGCAQASEQRHAEPGNVGGERPIDSDADRGRLGARPEGLAPAEQRPDVVSGGRSDDPDANGGRCEVERISQHAGERSARGNESDGLGTGRRGRGQDFADADGARLQGPDTVSRSESRAIVAERAQPNTPHPLPAIHRVDDGLGDQPDVCLRTLRADRLRAIGNGVHPESAALAWVTLADMLAG